MYQEDKGYGAKPVTPIAEEGWRTVLRKAAEYINEYGWCQHSYQDGQSVCMVGAINAVVNGSPQIERTDAVDVGYRATMQVHRVVGGTTRWNDQPGNTKEAVIRLLNQVADTP